MEAHPTRILIADIRESLERLKTMVADSTRPTKQTPPRLSSSLASSGNAAALKSSKAPSTTSREPSRRPAFWEAG